MPVAFSSRVATAAPCHRNVSVNTAAHTAALRTYEAHATAFSGAPEPLLCSCGCPFAHHHVCTCTHGCHPCQPQSDRENPHPDISTTHMICVPIYISRFRRRCSAEPSSSTLRVRLQHRPSTLAISLISRVCRVSVPLAGRSVPRFGTFCEDSPWNRSTCGQQLYHRHARSSSGYSPAK